MELVAGLLAEVMNGTKNMLKEEPGEDCESVEPIMLVGGFSMGWLTYSAIERSLMEEVVGELDTKAAMFVERRAP